MRALVTGGTGFIGANLVAGLNARGIAARVLRRPSSSLTALAGLTYESAIGDILGEVADLTAVMGDCDWVFHVAAVSDYWRHGEDWLYRVNVQGTKNVLAAAQAAGVKRFVFTSSLAALGVPANGKLLNESSQFNLTPSQFPYGHSKHLAELEVKRAVAGGLSAVIVNPVVVLGPRDVNEVSGSLVLEVAKGRLRFYLPGGVNIVAVENVVAGHIAAAERGRVGERYILGGENVSYETALRTICQVVGKKPPCWTIPGWGLSLAALGVDVARLFLDSRILVDGNQTRLSRLNLFADCNKVKREFDLQGISLRTAVEHTYNWYREHGYI